MLKRKTDFDFLEQELKENGKIKKFEEEFSKILGRVLIDFGEIPSELEDSVLNGKSKDDLFIFNCSFDFYDTTLGIALEKETLKIASDLWITEQVVGAERPAKEWIEFLFECW